jgi:hypothetical protein
MARHRLTHFDAYARPGNGPLSTLRNSRDASGPALLFSQADRRRRPRRQGRRIRLPDLTDELT